MNNDKISQLCDQALADYDFGKGVSVEATGGWEHDSKAKEVTCPVFLRFEEDDEDEDSHLATFSVTIVNGKITEASCIWDGEFIGTQSLA